jgi:hypothetical protein
MATHTLTDTNGKTTVLGSDAALTGFQAILPGTAHLTAFIAAKSADATLRKQIIEECRADSRLEYVAESFQDMVVPITLSP